MSDSLEASLTKQTYGCFKLDEFRQKREDLQEESVKRAVGALAGALDKEGSGKKKKRKKGAVATLSFGDELDEEAEPSPSTLSKMKMKKNTSVDVSFLKKNAAEAEEQVQRQQEAIRDFREAKKAECAQPFTVTFTFKNAKTQKDSSDLVLKRSVSIKRGATVGEMLQRVKTELIEELHWVELRDFSSDFLLVVNRFILPENMTFYELSRVKWAEGESMFDFSDGAMVRVTERKYYEDQRHVYPQTHWQIYDMGVTYEKAEQIRNRDRAAGTQAINDAAADKIKSMRK